MNKWGRGMEVELIEDKESILHVQVVYPVMNTNVQQLVERIKALDIKITVDDEKKSSCLSVHDIYYIESLERKTFIYTKDKVFRTNKKLYQLVEEYRDLSFVQINKSCLLNINVLVHVKTLFNSRLEATLDNGEKLIITRTYIPKVKSWLEGEAKTYEA